jgi:hypothetical protein
MTMLPEYEFDKCVARHKGYYRVRNLSCRDPFYVMSFAQLTLRESLWNIENCLTAFSPKLYHCSIKHAVPCKTLAKANELRDWQIYVDFICLSDLIHQKIIFFVTRAKNNMVYEMVSSNMVDKQT